MFENPQNESTPGDAEALPFPNEPLDYLGTPTLPDEPLLDVEPDSVRIPSDASGSEVSDAAEWYVEAEQASAQAAVTDQRAADTLQGTGINQLPPAGQNPAPVSIQPDSEERTWAMLAHLSILLNLVTGILGPLTALIIYLVYKDKSRYVAYQSLQAFVFQIIWWVGAGLLIGFMWVVVTLLSFVLVGLCLIPIAILLSLLPLGALVYGIYAAVQTNQGEDFRYWLIGDWLRGTLGEK